MSTIEQEGTLKHVDPATQEVTLLYPNIKTDDTLSIEGKAADAKAVGSVVVGKEEKGIWISQVDYDKLSEEEKMLDVDYYIYDAASSEHDIRWISQAEYDALSEEEKMMEIPYYIYDSDIEPNAYAVSFTSDQYEASNVGDALNEVKGDVDVVNESLAQSLHSMGNIFTLGLEDIATAPIGFYTSGNNSDSVYNIGKYSMIYKPSATNFSGAFYIRYTEGRKQDSIYVYRNSLSKFERLPTQDDITAINSDLESKIVQENRTVETSANSISSLGYYGYFDATKSGYSPIAFTVIGGSEAYVTYSGGVNAYIFAKSANTYTVRIAYMKN